MRRSSISVKGSVCSWFAPSGLPLSQQPDVQNGFAANRRAYVDAGNYEQVEFMSCRILYLIGQLHSGGSERQLFYLLRNMDRSRYRPAVAVWNFSEEDIYVSRIREIGVPIYSFPDGLSSTAKLRVLCSLVTSVQPEVVHSYSSYLNFAVRWSIRRTRAIAFGSTRSDFVLDWKGSSWWLGRMNARWPRNQIYNSFQAANLAS